MVKTSAMKVRGPVNPYGLGTKTPHTRNTANNETLK